MDRRGKEGLVYQGPLAPTPVVAFYLRVAGRRRRAARGKAVGADRASDKHAVDELFNAKFSEALKTIRQEVRLHRTVRQASGVPRRDRRRHRPDLNGYVLEDVAIDYLEQGCRAARPQQHLDAEGITKITRADRCQDVQTNELEQNEKAGDHQEEHRGPRSRSPARAQQADQRQQREVETVRAREAAETAKVIEEQREVSERARLGAEEQIKIASRNSCVRSRSPNRTAVAQSPSNSSAVAAPGSWSA